MKHFQSLSPTICHLPFTRAKDIVAPLPRQHGSEFEHLDTVLIASNVLLGIFELDARASAGEKLAAECLQNVARESTVTLRAICEAKPDLLSNLIREAVQWPMLVALHKENERANCDFLKKSGLGSNASINAISRSKWNRNNPAILWANDVIETIRANQRRWQLADAKSKRRFPKWAKSAALLEPLSKKTAGDWWKVGKCSLLERFPDPHKEKDLAALAQSECEDSRKRARVLYLIGRALAAMAP